MPSVGVDARLRVGMDMSILRHPRTGSARWATGLRDSLTARDDLDVVTFAGFRRPRRGGAARKVFNLLRDEYWFRRALPAAALESHVDVLMMPVNLSVPRGIVPQVVTVLDVNFLSQRGTYDRWYARYAAAAFRRAVNEADQVTTISSYSRDEIVTHLGADPASIRVIHPGLESPPADHGPPPISEPYALYVGATEPHKNVGLLLEAWRTDSPAGLRLAVVGQPGRDHDRLRSLAARLGGRVHIVGAVPGSELESWYRGASVFLFPSRTEGFGYPPLEAMQRRVPVVAARAGSLPEILGDGALFHAADDAEAVRDLVLRLQRDPDARSQLVARGVSVAGRYTWEATAARMTDALRDAVSGSS